MRKMRLLLLLVVLFATLFVIAFLWWKTALAAPSTNSEEIRFTITRGSSAESIGKNLAEAGLIKSHFAFKLYLSANGLITKLPPGQFLIAQNLTLPEVVDVLMGGPTELWVSIPEGLRREQYPAIFTSALGIDGEEKDNFHQTFLSETEQIEGTLFPDTYLFPPDITAPQAVSRLTSTFNQKFSPSSEEISRTGLSLSQIITLASIIERETRNPSERPEVAGVYFNRLNADWPLQADATVQYVAGTQNCRSAITSCNNWWTSPTRAQIDSMDSPYNTYKYTGLPPAPIANPSLSSLEAVINFTDTDYWFYIHDKAGQIYFARSLDEHNVNISRYLR